MATKTPLQSYKDLSRSKKQLLELISILYLTHQTEISDYARFCGLKTKGKTNAGKKYDTISIKLELEHFLEIGLIQKSNNVFQVVPAINHRVMLNAMQRDWSTILAKELKKTAENHYARIEHISRFYRFAFYSQKKDLFFLASNLLDFKGYDGKNFIKRFHLELFSENIDFNWLIQLQDWAIIQGVQAHYQFLIKEYRPFQPLVDFIFQYQKQNKSVPVLFFQIYMEISAIQGNWNELEDWLEDFDYQYYTFDIFRGLLAFVRKDYELSIKHYAEALKSFRKEVRSKKDLLNEPLGTFYLLALMKSGSPKHRETTKKLFENRSRSLNGYLYWLYVLMDDVLNSNEVDGIKILSTPKSHERYGGIYQRLMWFLALYWLAPEKLKKLKPQFKSFYGKLKKTDFHWIRAHADIIAEKHFPVLLEKNSDSPVAVENLIIDLFSPENIPEEWEASLNNLFALSQITKKPNKEEKRLIWLFDHNEKTGEFDICPKEQKINKNGEWSKGRKVSLSKLATGDIDCMTTQDRKVASTIGTDSYYGYGGYHYDFDLDEAIVSLIGHPLLLHAEPPHPPVELVKSEPEMEITQTEKAFEISYSIPFDEPGVQITKETPTRFRVLEVKERHLLLKAAIKKEKLIIPNEAESKLKQTLTGLRNIVTIHSELEEDQVNIELLPADNTPHIHILPFGDGLKMGFYTRPFQTEGPYVQPGSGPKTLYHNQDDKHLKTVRSFEAEEKQLNEIIEHCPSLMEINAKEDSLVFDNPEDSLQLLSELKAIEDKVHLEWPESKPLKVTTPTSFDNFRLSVKKNNDWFELSGELDIGQGEVILLKTLLEHMDQTNKRFIPIGDDQYLALTESFRKKLDSLKSWSDHSAKNVRMHPLAAMAFQDIEPDFVNLKTDKNWKNWKKQAEKVFNMTPLLPSTLQAELRDYQIEGFRWLYRLSEMEMGACLADDMGLGKTLQALALVLTRATNGPTLVIAPVSVCNNWSDEAARFAPTLRVKIFGGKNRQEMLDQVHTMDLVVCSYGLLQQEGEMLSKVEWETVILDEAQAIKNIATKRTKAAIELSGKFKMVLTGTPIENHLGELWSLFQFINPGLLGSYKKFQEKFAGPIERGNNAAVRKHLKNLVHPFILRRIKSQVLDELPEKTEISLEVNLTSEETALYEAMRQKTLETLSSMEAPKGEAHLRILAEIMKLRRLCCHPDLSAPGLISKSSKMELFDQVLDDLQENKHKALVFSQFVDYLGIIRKHLDQRGIHYQYLDGSTSMKERKKRVDAFQSGDGDLFLISLKAGGTGLNLTAANYVIHMDPWWNPAVEDQASDRAHRIGQKQPVTIYRLVTKNTIEEKILKLHHDKRNLADKLLEGTDAAGKVSAKELLEILQEGR